MTEYAKPFYVTIPRAEQEKMVSDIVKLREAVETLLDCRDKSKPGYIEFHNIVQTMENTAHYEDKP